MKYFAKEMTLYTDDGRLIKQLNCPLKKEWDQLVKVDHEDRKRKCNSCERNVLDISHLSEDEVTCIVRYDPSVCIHIRSDSDAVTWVNNLSDGSNVTWIGDEGRYSGQFSGRACNRRLSEIKGCRIIRTARKVHEMEQAAKDGYRVLLQVIKENPDIQSKLAVCQNSETQRLEFIGDLREYREDITIDFVSYNPSVSSFPIAAYIVPRDIKNGERVFILDLIENIVSETWNQGDAYRLESGYATWDGEGFDIDEIKVHETIG